MFGQIVAQLRLYIVLALGLGIVVIDSVSRTISMLADLALVGLLAVVVVPVLLKQQKESTATKQ